MDTEIIIEDENNHENLTTTAPMLQSVQDKTMDAAKDTDGKKRKKGVFNPQLLLDVKFRSFLREYKPDPTEVVCIACNEQFSIHHGGKNDIDRHAKLKKQITSMKSSSINRQLITATIKPNKDGEETAAAEGIIDLIEDPDESATKIYENLKDAIKKAGLHLEGLSNAYVEAIFSEMKKLLNDFRNRMSLDSIAAELQIRRNGSMSCTDHILLYSIMFHVMFYV
ncbi:unnamed protein product [Rotaria sp. Silwood1]|nr:unnamed protein product [Rotaria sp. Silwood1]